MSRMVTLHERTSMAGAYHIRYLFAIWKIRKILHAEKTRPACVCIPTFSTCEPDPATDSRPSKRALDCQQKTGVVPRSSATRNLSGLFTTSVLQRNNPLPGARCWFESTTL